MYTFGSAGTGSTYRNNFEALDRWRIIPRMLRNVTHRNLDVRDNFSHSRPQLTKPF
jgi:lactate 2-monooxygenase